MQELFWTLSKYIFKTISKSDDDYLKHDFWITAKHSHFWHISFLPAYNEGGKNKKGCLHFKVSIHRYTSQTCSTAYIQAQMHHFGFRARTAPAAQGWLRRPQSHTDAGTTGLPSEPGLQHPLESWGWCSLICPQQALLRWEPQEYKAQGEQLTWGKTERALIFTLQPGRSTETHVHNSY